MRCLLDRCRCQWRMRTARSFPRLAEVVLWLPTEQFLSFVVGEVERMKAGPVTCRNEQAGQTDPAAEDRSIYATRELCDHHPARVGNVYEHAATSMELHEHFGELASG